MFSSKINYEENFSNAQYNPIEEEDVEFLWEMESGELQSGYDD